jgi:diacylglycerol kinase (ATP)
MKRVEIVFNPNAGRGRAAALARELSSRLSARGMEAMTSTIGEFLCESGTIARGCDVVVALGGDGTVRAIVEGLAARFAEESPPVAVLAMGTANLIARHLALPWSDGVGLDRLLDAIDAGRTRPVDLPLANGRPFLLMCSIGFDAQVVHEVAARRTGPISKLDYLPAFARSVMEFRKDAIEVRADGKLVFGPAPALVVVANAAEYGTGFSLNPTATSNDGALDLAVFDAGQRKHLLSAAFHAVTNQISDGAAIVMTAKQIDITGDAAPAQVDGEAFGHVPIHIGLLPYRQRFIVPA